MPWKNSPSGESWKLGLSRHRNDTCINELHSLRVSHYKLGIVLRSSNSMKDYFLPKPDPLVSVPLPQSTACPCIRIRRIVHVPILPL